MKRQKNTIKILNILVVGMVTLGFFSCQQQDPLSASMPSGRDVSEASQPQFLKFKGNHGGLNKKKSKKKNITKHGGGVINVVHGNATGSATSTMLANNWNPPYNVYGINPLYPDRQVLMGQLAFKSAAMAMHPYTGMVYYVANVAVDGIYPVGVWDPETNINSILPGGSPFKPCGKLAFHPDGTLYGVKKANTKQVYTIDVNSGEWTLFATLNRYLKVGGGMTFSPNGQKLFSTGGLDPQLKVTDLASATVTHLQQPGQSNISGLCYSSNGHLYYVTRNGRIGIANPQTGTGQILTSTGIDEINSLVPLIASTELTYAEISLNILPNSIEQDTEIEISLETTELTGSVWVTFQPHGTVFSPPAVLNFVAHGVDFSGIDPNAVNIFYDNPESGEWEVMPSEAVIVNVHAGTLRVVNARLPHFSRYGVAAD